MEKQKTGHRKRSKQTYIILLIFTLIAFGIILLAVLVHNLDMLVFAGLIKIPILIVGLVCVYYTFKFLRENKKTAWWIIPLLLWPIIFVPVIHLIIKR